MTLSGTNLYAGGTTLTIGTINATNTAATNVLQALGTGLITLNGGTLGLSANGSASSQTIVSGNGTTGNNVTVGGATTISFSRATGGTFSSETLQFNNLSIGATTLTLTTAGNSYAMQFAGTTTLTGNATFNVVSAPLTLTGAIGDGINGFGLTKLGSSALTLGSANTYTGATTFGAAAVGASAGTTTLSNSVSINTSSAVSAYGSGTKLTLDYSGVAGNAAVNRIKDTATVTLGMGAELSLTSNATVATNTSETVGGWTIDKGAAILSAFTGTIPAGQLDTLAVGSTGFTRSNNATALIRGANLGTAATAASRITINGTAGTGLTLIGTNTSSLGAVTSGTDKQLKIVPYFIGSTSGTGVGTNFLTYDTNAITGGLRLLAAAAATAEQSLISSGATNDNVKTIAGANTVSSGAKVFNSLLIGAGTNSATPSTAAATVTGAGGVGDTLTLTSGALANVATGASGTGSISGFSSIIFGTTGANEAIITNANTNAAGTFTIGSPINTASAGGGLTTTGGGTTILTAANLYTGQTNINQGILQIGNGGTTGDLGAGSSGVFVGTGASLAYNRTNTFTTNGSVTGGGTVNSNNATGTLTLNQAGSGLTLKSTGGVSGATLVFGGDGTGVTSLGDATGGTLNYMLVAGENYKFTSGTVNLLDNARGFLSNIEIAGGTVNVVNNPISMSGVASGTQTFTINSGTLNANASNGVSGFNGAGGASQAGTANSTFVGTQTGGTINISGTIGRFDMGSTSAGDVTTYNFSGGTISQTNSTLGMTLGADTAGTSTTTFNVSGGKLIENFAINGNQGSAARQAFVWTGGTLATLLYTATNLTSVSGAAYAGNVGALTNGGGILAPGDIGTAGKTGITGNYNVTSASAAYAADIGGTTAASVFQAGAGSYDQTIVTGTTALNGRLNFSLINGYTPPSDTTTLFAVLKGNTAATSTVTGTFTNLVTATSGNSRVVGADGLSSFLLAINNTAVAATVGGLTNVGARNVALGGYQAGNTYSGASTAWDTASAAAWTNFDAGATASPSTQASNAIAQFADGTASTGSIGVSLNSTRNIQGIQFASAAGSRAYSITNAGSGAIILDNTSNAVAATIADTSTSGTANAINVPITLNSNLAVSVTNAANNLTIGSVIGETLVGATLSKTGAGNLILSGANTYTGGTTVSVGTLLVNNTTNSGTGTGAVAVSSGAILGGSGTISGATTISGSLRPGNNSLGKLTVANNVTWTPGNSWVFDLGTAATTMALANTGSSTQDFLQITSGGNFTKGAGSGWTFDFAGVSQLGWYKLAQWTGGSTDFSAGVNTQFSATDLGGAYTGTFTVDAATSALYLNVVPEPTTWALLAFSLTTVMVLRRRQK